MSFIDFKKEDLVGDFDFSVKIENLGDPLFKIPVCAILDENNLDWQKAKRWGKQILDSDGIKIYQWNDNIYLFEDSK